MKSQKKFPLYSTQLSKLNTTNSRFIFNIPRRLLTAEERQRVNAFSEALETALSQVDGKDIDGRLRIRAEVEEAHPLTQEVRDAWSLETIAQFADPLRNVADEISFGKFKPDAPCGLVVYRTAYGNDVAWNRMLEELNDTIDFLQYGPVPNPELYHRHRFEIMNDRSQFEAATIDSLHEKFSMWVVDEYRANCKEDYRPSVEEFTADTVGKESGYVGGARYNFFLVVDEICLESLDQECGAVVKVVQRAGHASEGDSYSAEEIQEMGPRQEDSDWEGGVTESEFENVGWMYMETPDYAAVNERLADPGDWEDHYLRLPQLRSLVGFKDTPGSWRR